MQQQKYKKKFLSQSKQTQCRNTSPLGDRAAQATHYAAEMSPATHYTLQRTTASIMKIRYFLQLKIPKDFELKSYKKKSFEQLNFNYRHKKSCTIKTKFYYKMTAQNIFKITLK